MEDYIQNQLSKQLSAYIISVNRSDLELNIAGFINDNCSSLWLHILLNCVNNIHIFNVEQTNTIANIINKLRYGTTA